MFFGSFECLVDLYSCPIAFAILQTIVIKDKTIEQHDYLKFIQIYSGAKFITFLDPQRVVSNIKRKSISRQKFRSPDSILNITDHLSKFKIVQRFYIYMYIHAYINGHYNPSVRITIQLVCVNFIHEWHDLQFKVDSQ